MRAAERNCIQEKRRPAADWRRPGGRHGIASVRGRGDDTGTHDGSGQPGGGRAPTGEKHR